MFKRLLLCLVLAGAPLTAVAQSVQDQIVSQLQAQGFDKITLNNTWLGRVRVIALRNDLRRELVFNPQTGEILRDYWVTLDDDDNDDGPRIFNPDGGGSSSGNAKDDDDDDDSDDRDDDDRNDDDDDDEDDDDDRDDDDDEEDDDDEDDEDDE